MRDYDAFTLARLQANEDTVAKLLVWISGRNRETGEIESLGLWDGDDDQVINIDGTPRTYNAGGSLISVAPIQTETGTDVRMQSISLSPINDAVIQAIRVYEPRLAPIEIHRALLDPQSGAVIGDAHPVFKGWVDEVSITTPAAGGEGSCDVRCASSARAGTRTLGLKWSDESLKRRGTRIARYADISGAERPEEFWGLRGD